jgi:pheromone shutdown protein TraB
MSDIEERLKELEEKEKQRESILKFRVTAFFIGIALIFLICGIGICNI